MIEEKDEDDFGKWKVWNSKKLYLFFNKKWFICFVYMKFI